MRRGVSDVLILLMEVVLSIAPEEPDGDIVCRTSSLMVFHSWQSGH